jgi:hypothetical protein
MQWRSRMHWRSARKDYLTQYMRDAAPGIDGSDPSPPGWIRGGLTVGDWYALSRDERARRCLDTAKAIWLDAFPMPEAVIGPGSSRPANH